MGGRKVWAADDVLAAADLNEYLGDQVSLHPRHTLPL